MHELPSNWQQFSAHLTSLTWWIGGVILLIVIHVIALYVIRMCDSSFSRSITWWQKWSTKRKRSRLEFIQRFKNSPNLQTYSAFWVTDTKQFANTVLIGAGLLTLYKELAHPTGKTLLIQWILWSTMALGAYALYHMAFRLQLLMIKAWEEVAREKKEKEKAPGTAEA